jgi:CRISPR-associated endoribonuclease Cas6
LSPKGFPVPLQDNLLRKYEMIYNEKLNPENNFIEYFQIKNNKPQTLFFKSIKFFGWKLYIIPRNDEISQKLAFIALGSGLGHKNSSVGGGFMKYKMEFK